MQNILPRIATITDKYLNMNKNHDENEIVNDRVELAALNIYLSGDVNKKRKEADIDEFNAKKKELEVYSECRRGEMSIKDAEVQAKYDAMEYELKAIETRAEARRYQLVHSSVEKLLDALSSKIKALEAEKVRSNYQT